MSRRSRSGWKHGVKPKPYAQALDCVDTLEMNVIRRLPPVTYDVSHVMHALYPAHILEKLKVAWSICDEDCRRDTLYQRVQFPYAAAYPQVMFTLKPDAAGLLPPKQAMAVQYLQEPLVLETVKRIHDQFLQFEKVRRSVMWLNDHATVSAARHYCPWLANLLPSDHPIQKVDGQLFKQPTASMGEIIHDMRQCEAIVASALLAGTTDKETRTAVAVQFYGVNTQQDFWII